jgi:histone deacetylase 6
LERVRLRNISLRTQLRKVERTLKAKEQLAEGLHMIDFEQLKIENQTLNEKIEERNEELGKLKHKKTLTVQVLTHIREKLRFVQQEIDGVREVLGEIDADINGQRATLASLKRERDVLKNENAELRRLQGFATSDLLLTLCLTAYDDDLLILEQ